MKSKIKQVLLDPVAEKLAKRHAMLLKNVPSCPKCKGKVKLKQSGQLPAIWQCKECNYPFLWEPE